jgi:hypothetical protein
MNDYPGFNLGNMDLRNEFEYLQFLADHGNSYIEDSMQQPCIPKVQDSPGPTSVLGSQRDHDRESQRQQYSFSADELMDDIPDLENVSVARGCDPRTTVDSGASIEIFANSSGSWDGLRLLSAISKDGSTETVGLAAAGGIVSYKGSYYLQSVNHFLIPNDSLPQHPRTISDEADCEVSGLSDFEDDEEDDWAEVTSRASRSRQSSLSGAPRRDTINRHGLSFTLGNLAGQEDQGSPIQARLERVALTGQHQPTPDRNTMQKIGSVAVSSSILDYSLTRINIPLKPSLSLTLTQLRSIAVPLQNYQAHIETAARDTPIKTTTPDGRTIGGYLYGTPSFVRLPHSTTYQKVLVCKMQQPLVSGDCGSWVRSVDLSKVFGHIIAGSPTTGLVWVMPAGDIFAHARHYLDKHPDPVPNLQAVTIQHPLRYRDSPAAISNPIQSSLLAGVLDRPELLLPPPLPELELDFDDEFEHRPESSYWIVTPPPPPNTRRPRSRRSHSSESSRGSSVSSQTTRSSLSTVDSSQALAPLALGDYRDVQPQPPWLECRIEDSGPDDLSLPCEFAQLSGCSARFALNDSLPWILHHAEEHFRDHLPNRLACWFCDVVFEANLADGPDWLWSNFHRRMDHIQSHFIPGQRIRTRPDMNVIVHAGQHGLILPSLYRAWMDYTEVPLHLRLPGCIDGEPAARGSTLTREQRYVAYDLPRERRLQRPRWSRDNT